MIYCLLPISYYLLPMPSPCHGPGPVGLPWAGPLCAPPHGPLCGPGPPGYIKQYPRQYVIGYRQY